MPNTLGLSESLGGNTAMGNSDIFSSTVNDILGSTRDAIVNGIPKAVDGLLTREFAEGQDQAGFAPVGDDRTERVAPQDTTARSVIPFMQGDNKGVLYAAGGVLAVGILAVLILKR